MRSENAEERWDLYTKEREKTGRTHRRGDAMPQDQYRLAVHVCIFNSKNQLLIQQRQPYKKGWPNMWDVSAAGSAVSGESSAQAAQRELMEELGLAVSLSEVRPFFTMSFPNGFDDFYVIEQDVNIAELHLQEEEVRQVRWAEKEDVVKMQAQGIMIPYWFLDRLFDIRDGFDAQWERRHNIRYGTAGFHHLESWMSLAEIVRYDFPGMDTDGAMNDLCETTIRYMKQGGAVYAADGNMVVGALLFRAAAEKEAKKKETYGQKALETSEVLETSEALETSEVETLAAEIRFLAVHPEYRRQNIAQQLLERMMHRLDDGRDIIVETFREGDQKGTAARAFYQSLGFVPGETGLYQGYPVQIFVLKRKK